MRIPQYARTVQVSLLVAFLLVSRACGGQVLQATVLLDLSRKHLWDYTIVNMEPSDSPYRLTSFFLPLQSPISQVQAPLFWTADTDLSRYILWTSADPSGAGDLPPGASLGGFGFVSRACEAEVTYRLTSRDDHAGEPGPMSEGATFSPAGAEVVPEPGGLVLCCTGAALGAGFATLRSHKLGAFTRKHVRHVSSGCANEKEAFCFSPCNL